MPTTKPWTEEDEQNFITMQSRLKELEVYKGEKPEKLPEDDLDDLGDILSILPAYEKAKQDGCWTMFSSEEARKMLGNKVVDDIEEIISSNHSKKSFEYSEYFIQYMKNNRNSQVVEASEYPK